MGQRRLLLGRENLDLSLPSPVPFTQHTLFTNGQSKYRKPNLLRMADAGM